MTCRACVQLTLDVYGIYSSTDNKILRTPRILLVYLAALDNGRNPDIGTLKNRGETSFQNAALKYLKQNLYVMSMNYYFKW